MKLFKYCCLVIGLVLAFVVKSQNISLLGQWSNNPNFKIKYRQNRLIITTVSGVRFLNVSNPANPVPTSAFISS